MNNKIAVIGLGYVGLPLAIEFGKKFETIGYDINGNRIKELNNKFDCTGETTAEDLEAATKLILTDNSIEINDSLYQEQLLDYIYNSIAPLFEVD